MKTLGVTVIRYDSETGMPSTDGDECYYASVLHFFKEALEHGMTLAEAIEACEAENGK